MKTRKIPMRTCVITNEKYPKMELIRIVRTPEGEILIDETGKRNGHGAYVKMDVQIVEKARKSKKLDRYLEVSVPEKIYLDLINLINNKDGNKQ